MNEATAGRLLQLNREFYDRFAREFSETRARLSPGVIRALAMAGEAGSLLDLGCGDGRVGRALRDQVVKNRVRRYRGVDFSPELLRLSGFTDKEPRPPSTSGPALDFEMLEADLASPGWSTHPDLLPGSFDLAVCLAVLFHLPGAERRAAALREMGGLLSPGGRAVISVWQFLHLPRMRAHVVPWEAAALSQTDVDPGDLLVDWRRGGSGLRYVHHFEEEELRRLCGDAGLRIRETYRADGASGDMSLFAVAELQVPSSPRSES